MNCYYDEMQNIYSRLEEIEAVINPCRNPFIADNTHPLSKERDDLCRRYWELKEYDNSFKQRKNPIIVSMYITGAGELQARINYSVAYNNVFGTEVL